MILQTSIPYDPTRPRPLPGISPLDSDDWIIVDDAFSGQMALRDRLLADHRDKVVALDRDAFEIASELLETVLGQLIKRPDYTVDKGHVLRPDGVWVELDPSDPMGTLGRLVQQDFCILQQRGDEHVLTGAVLCFPASWMLSEKFMKPLIDIHIPVNSYDGDIAKRVQRLFNGIRAGRPLWRFNALWYDDAELHQPRSANARRDIPDTSKAYFLRSERQSLWRLPESNAVVFGIHTFVLTRDAIAAQFGSAE